MPKNIVLLSDGTGNSAAKVFRTNVWRLYQALDLSDPTQQIAFYNDGVGTSSFKPLAILGGAFGFGLKRNVIEIYAFLCRNYEPGDRIYCFGFSRGAFTIRVLSGLIHAEGLVNSQNETELQARAKLAFRNFRREHFKGLFPWLMRGLSRSRKQARARYEQHRAARRTPPIHFLGLWDTVAAYGLPLDELTRAWNAIFPLSVPNREPLRADQVHKIRHAIAIDDERNTFHPVLFNEDNLPDRNTTHKNIHEERVTQVWFAGMHSDVGGGYPDDGLSYVPLDWMMDLAEAKPATPAQPAKPGLLFKPAERAEARRGAVPLGKMYDSRRGLGGFYRYLPRKIEDLTNDTIDKRDQVVVARPKIHESAIERIRQGTDRYAPIVLPKSYAVVTTNGNIVDQPHFEDASQSQNRANRQEEVFNLVWWKRVVYFSSILVFLVIVAFPLIRKSTEACENAFCFLSPVIGWIGAFLPSFASTWVKAFQFHPGSFGALASLFALSLWTGSRIQGRIFDKMNSLWEPVRAAPRAQVPVALLPSDFLFLYRTSEIYRSVVRLMKGYVLPAVVGVVTFVALAETALRMGFRVIESGGRVCTVSTKHKDPFPTNEICWDSHKLVRKGKRYRITLDVSKTKSWQDNGIPATLAGVDPKDITPVMYSAVLMRRVLGEPWFQPMARIGVTGTDLYSLTPAEGDVPTPGDRAFTAEITARRDGELFFFVNDAVLPVPNAWQRFYNNNGGAAKVTVCQKIESSVNPVSNDANAPAPCPRDSAVPPPQ